MKLRAILASLILVISTAAAATAARPDLVVVVSIDQFPHEYLERMQAGFAPDGMFRRLLDRGAVYTQCHHGHAFTITGPGHSVLLTGTFPCSTGIVDNNWLDRDTGKKIYCVEDDAYPLVGAQGAGISPKNLLTGTVGDVMKFTWPTSRVFGVAMKDRAAILMTGHAADACYWYDAVSGNWITSKYYRDDLPQFLRVFNESSAVESYAGQSWNLLLPEDKYVHYYADAAKFENPGGALGNAFPHKLPDDPKGKYYDTVSKTPWGNEITLSVAKLLVTDEKLGLGPTPDFLAINLSTNDFIGHAYGPRSLEVQDCTFRTDRQLGEFAKFIDEHLGDRSWVFGLSSDHGVAPVPEDAQQMRLPGKRNPIKDVLVLRNQIEAKLRQTLGTPEKEFIQSIDYGEVFLRRDLPQLQGDNYALAQRLVRDALLRDPAVAVAFTREELLSGMAPGGLALQFQRTLHPERSGDVLFATQPYTIGGSTPATHGSPWRYDSHVPLALWGKGIKPGRYTRGVTPAALGPTISRLLEIELPPATAVDPLHEVLNTFTVAK